jgi:mycothiol synthase
MIRKLDIHDEIRATQIEGVIFRQFRGEADYQPITDLENLFNATYENEEVISVEEIVHAFEHPTEDQDFARDMLVTEVDKRLIGFAVVKQRLQADGDRVFWQDVYVHPIWQAQVEPALLQFTEQRANQMAIEKPVDAPHYLSLWRPEKNEASIALILTNGYAPSRHYFDMRRDLLASLPTVRQPEGVVVRSFEPTEHNYRAVYVGNREAFRDHYGYQEWTEADYQNWRNDPMHNTALWRIAYDVATGEVAGVAINTIFEADNETYGFKRGWVNNLSVRRPWRGKGVAKALLVESFIALREHGMTEAMLGVDAANPTGALQLYESVGFEVYKRNTVYRKAMTIDDRRLMIDEHTNVKRQEQDRHDN